MRTLVVALSLLVSLFAFAAPASVPAELSVPGGVLHGTLLMPDTKGPAPVVLLIAGSGPTDRNGNTPLIAGANNSLKLIAEALAQNGIASLRYDKRGIGESAAAMTAEADLRFDTYVDDASRWCAQLRAERRFSSVVIAGHSEGSLIGMLAAKRCDAGGYVSIAGLGQNAGKTLRTQLAGKLPADLAAQSEAILVSLEAGKTTSDVPDSLLVLYRPSVQPYMISWLRYDPVKAIAELPMPVLIVQGSTDIQVTVDDAKRLSAASPKATLLIIEGMNHVLKSVSDPSKQMASYGDPALPLASELVPAIVKLVRRAEKKH